MGEFPCPDGTLIGRLPLPVSEMTLIGLSGPLDFGPRKRGDDAESSRFETAIAALRYGPNRGLFVLI
jgi:hypothetical protein